MDHEKELMVGGIKSTKIGGFTEGNFKIDIPDADEAKRIAQKMHEAGVLYGELKLTKLSPGVACTDKGNVYFIESSDQLDALVKEYPVTPVFWIENVGTGDIYFGPNPLMPGMKIEIKIANPSGYRGVDWCTKQIEGLISTSAIAEFLTDGGGVFQDNLDRLEIMCHVAKQVGRELGADEMSLIWHAMGGEIFFDAFAEPDEDTLKMFAERIFNIAKLDGWRFSDIELKRLWKRSADCVKHDKPWVMDEFLDARDQLNKARKEYEEVKSRLNK